MGDEVAALVQHVVAEQLSEFKSEIVSLQIRVSALETVQPPGTQEVLGHSEPGSKLSPESEQRHSAREMQKLANVTFYTPLEPLAVSDAPPWQDTGSIETGTNAALPESILNYCMIRLALSEHPWRDPALRHLLVLVATQQLLLSTFMLGADIALFDLMESSKSSFGQCVMDSVWSLGGQSIMDWSADFASMFLIAAMLKSHDMEHLEIVQYPTHRLGFGIWSLLKLVWFMQVIYLPALFCIEAGILFSSRADAMGVIMNGLAVSYIMEVDSGLYWNLLDHDARAAYQSESAKLAHARPSQQHVSRYAWLIFVFNMSFMLYNHVFVSFISNLSFEAMDRNQGIGTFVIQTLYGLRAAVQFMMVRAQGEDAQEAMTCRCRFMLCSQVCLIVLLSTIIACCGTFLATGILTGNLFFDLELPTIVPSCQKHL